MRQPSTFRATAMAIIAISSLVLTGCRSMYDPAPRAPGDPSRPYVVPTLPTYQDAMTYATQLEEAYRNAVVRDAVVTDRLAAGLIPLGAAAMGVGVTGGSTNALTALSLGTGTGIGLGTWFSGRARREVFGVGAEALRCVKKAASPLNVGEDRLSALLCDRHQLDRDLRVLDKAIIALEAPDGSPASPDLQAALANAKDVRRDGDAALVHVDDVLSRLNAAGASIVEAVNDVRLKVTIAAVNTSRDIRDLQDHLKASVYGPFQDILGMATPAGKAEDKAGKTGQQLQGLAIKADRKAAGEKATEEEKRRAAQIKHLQNAVQAARAAAAQLNRDLQSINVSGVSSEFAKCLDAVKGLKPPINVTPASLTVKQGGKDSFVISSGKAPYRLRPGWGPVAITLSQPTGEPAKVDVAVDEKVGSGDYGLTVRDDAGSETSVTIHVTAKDQTAATPPATPAAVDVGKLQGDIKKALNEKLPGAGWAGIDKPGGKAEEWKATSPDDEHSAFTLKFASPTDAANAAKSPMAQKLSGLNTVKGSASDVTLLAKDSQLVLTVPNTDLLQGLAEDIAGLAKP